MAHTFNPSTQEAEAGETFCVAGNSSLPEIIPGQVPKLWRNPVSKHKQASIETIKRISSRKEGFFSTQIFNDIENHRAHIILL